MSTVAASARAQAAELARSRVSLDAFVLTALSGLVALLVVFTWGTWGDLGSDTGYDFVAGTRVAHGDFPYVDYVYYYGPLAPFLVGLAAWLGGAGIEPVLVLGVVIATAIVGATYLLGRRLAGPAGGGLAAGITAPLAFAPSNFSFVLPHSFSASLGILATLGFLLAAERYSSVGGRWLLVAGLAAGIVALTRPEFELAILVAGTLWLFLRRRSGVGSPRELLAFALPALALPAAVYGAFLVAVSPASLLFDNLYPRDVLRAGGGHLLDQYAPLSASSFASLAGKLALYTLGAAVLVGIAALLARPGRSRALVGAGVACVAVVCAAASIARPETLRYGLEFVYGWIPAGALLAVGILVWRARRSASAWTAAEQAALLVATALGVLAAKTYAGFLFHATVPQLAVYAAPFAAVFLARLHLVEIARGRTGFALGALWLTFLAAAGTGLTLKDAHAESATVSGPGGSLAAKPGDAPAYSGALSWIEKHSKPGEGILLAPQLTGLYELSGRTDVLPEISLHPGALPDATAERAAVRRLDRAGVRLAVVDRRSFPEYGQTSFGGSFDKVVAGWLHAKFRHVATLRGSGPRSPTLDVWLRRSP